MGIFRLEFSKQLISVFTFAFKLVRFHFKSANKKKLKVTGQKKKERKEKGKKKNREKTKFPIYVVSSFPHWEVFHFSCSRTKSVLSIFLKKKKKNQEPIFMLGNDSHILACIYIKIDFWILTEGANF